MKLDNPIVIHWEMKVFDDAKFVEEIDVSSMRSNSYIGWGTYYSNLAWVYCIKNNIMFLTQYPISVVSVIIYMEKGITTKKKTKSFH